MDERPTSGGNQLINNRRPSSDRRLLVNELFWLFPAIDDKHLWQRVAGRDIAGTINH